MKLLKNLFFTLCFCLMLALPASAYIDPSVATFTIQVIAGAAVAIGAVVGIVWRKAKKKVQDKLGIDENANKEVEEDIQFDDEDDD